MRGVPFFFSLSFFFSHFHVIFTIISSLSGYFFLVSFLFGGWGGVVSGEETLVGCDFLGRRKGMKGDRCVARVCRRCSFSFAEKLMDSAVERERIVSSRKNWSHSRFISYFSFLLHPSLSADKRERERERCQKAKLHPTTDRVGAKQRMSPRMEKKKKATLRAIVSSSVGFVAVTDQL